MRRMMTFLAVLMLLGTALPGSAEEIPTLTRAASSIYLGSREKTYTLYSGPGEDYFVAEGEADSVSHQYGQVWCYGRAGDGWLMVTREDRDGRYHIGYVHAPEASEAAAAFPLLSFAARQVMVKADTPILDEYRERQPIGTVSGQAVLLMYFPNDMAYIEATEDGSGLRVRGFIRRSDIDGSAAFNMPEYPGAADYLSLADEYALSLPADARAEGMNVYPLTDGTLLIAYRCEGSDRLWMRVISRTGRKLFAKSVPELYLIQITLTDSGFICDTFDNSEIDSGVRYTYTCKGYKWKSAKIRYVDDPDRYYSDNTANFTLRRYPFGEGSVIPMEIEHRAAGTTARHLMTYGSAVDLCEFEDFDNRNHLVVHAEDENGVMAVRMYDIAGQLVGSAASPMTAPVGSAWGFRNAIWFYTGSGAAWQRWRLDAQTFTFSEPDDLTLPEDCTLTVLCGESSGDQLVLLDAQYACALCRVTSWGAVQLVRRLEGDAIWAMHADGGLLLLRQTEDGKFLLQRYNLSNG